MQTDIYSILSKVNIGNVEVQVASIDELRGSSDPRNAETMYFTAQTGMKLKFVKIILNDTKVRTEPGSLYYMNGKLEMKASTGGGIAKGLFRKATSGESFFVNEIHGTGTVVLEPTFGHFLLHEMSDGNDGLICDKGMFYAGAGDLDISAKMQKSVSAGAMGGEGWFQTSITGTGIAVLFSPVPQEEITIVELNDEKLSVDGNFALMRTGGVNFKAEKSSKSWMSTAVSGEGLLQTFSGTGKVWLAPTQGVYEQLATNEGMAILSKPPGGMGTNVEQ
jgi:uncharacterized protein (AIM24 family)